MRKLALMRTATGRKDPELHLLQKIISLDVTAPQIAAQINASQTSSNTHLNINYSEDNQAFLVKLLQRNHYTNNKKRLA